MTKFYFRYDLGDLVDFKASRATEDYVDETMLTGIIIEQRYVFTADDRLGNINNALPWGVSDELPFSSTDATPTDRTLSRSDTRLLAAAVKGATAMAGAGGCVGKARSSGPMTVVRPGRSTFYLTAPGTSSAWLAPLRR